MKPSLKSPLVLALTLGVFLALAGGTLAVTGAFNGDDGPTANAAQDQYTTTEGNPSNPGNGAGAELGAQAGSNVGAGGGEGAGAGAGAAVGAGAGAGGAGAGAGAGGGVDNGMCPYRMKVLSGSLIEGQASPDLCFLDHDYVKVKSGSPTDWIAYFDNSHPSGGSFRPAEGASSLGVTIDGYNTDECIETVSLYDYAGNGGKGEWDLLVKREVGTHGISWRGTGNEAGANYVSNGEARVRVRCVNGDAKFVNVTDRLILIPG